MDDFSLHAQVILHHITSAGISRDASISRADVWVREVEGSVREPRTAAGGDRSRTRQVTRTTCQRKGQGIR